MLVRAYRISDKLGVVLLKSGAGLSTMVLEGIHQVVLTAQSGTGNILRLVALLVLSLFAGLRWIVVGISTQTKRVLGGLGTILIWIFGHLSRLVGGILAIAGGAARRIGRAGIRVSGRAGGSVSGQASRAMARRSARAEMDVGLAEDPLRVQNRILSVMVVIFLVALIAIVIWATSNQDTGIPVPSGIADLGSGNDDTTPQEDQAAPSVVTPVPTATELPEVLQARGSLAYVVRERGQTDIWAAEVGSLTPIRIIGSPEDDRDPAWANHSMRLAYASRQEDSNWDIYIYDLITDTTTRMTYNLAFEARPKWSPDDAYLIYESYQADTHLDLFVMRSDPNASEGPTRLAASSDSADFSPAWSPDLRHIAFVSWREGNQDIYIFSLDTQETYNLTRTPNRHEDYPSWSPDGQYLAFSAVEAGIETVFVQEADNPNAQAVAFRRGRTPAWSPSGGDISSIVFAVDASDSTFLTVAPFGESGVATEVIQAASGATMPVWTSAPLPPALVNSGGVDLAITEPLYNEQVDTTGGDPPYGLGTLINISGVEPAYLSDRVNDSFNALRERVNEVTGIDFLDTLSDAWWDLDHRPQPGEPNQNWHRTGRAFSFNRNLVAGFPPPIEVVREDTDLQTFWRIYVRVADEAQTGQLGEPLRRMPWDFQSRDRGDVEAYEQGGRLRDEIPSGYYVDLTQIAEDYQWMRVPAGSDWRDNFNARNFWTFQKRDGLTWYDAMREIWAESQLGGWVPTATPEGDG
jgi:TolB protein